MPPSAHSFTPRAPRKAQRLIAILIGCVFATPSVAATDCYERMSRIPTASPAAAVPAGYRASMLRGAPQAAASPAKKASTHRPARKKSVRKAKPSGATAVAHKAKAPGKKSGIRRASAKRRAATRPRPVVAAARPQPTAPAVAARDIARLREFTLIKTTICTQTPPPTVIVGPPPEILEPETLTLLPPLGPPDTLGPEITIVPPAPPFPTDDGPFIVVVRPPTGPPGPPALEPPGQPDAVPEPGTWLLLILGFGALGARLRARRTAI